MLILSLVIIVAGGFLTYKVVDNQDFEHEEVKYKWINYMFASIGAGWLVPTLFNLILSIIGVTLLSTNTLMFGVFIVLLSLFVSHLCNYKGKEVWEHLYKAIHKY